MTNGPQNAADKPNGLLEEPLKMSEYFTSRRYEPANKPGDGDMT